MRLHTFIQENLDVIVDRWQAFARTLLPAAITTSGLTLRDHCREILIGVVEDMQTDADPDYRSNTPMRVEGLAVCTQTSAATHGALRHAAGFDLTQLVSEFRAMRSSVFVLWRHNASTRDRTPTIDETERFNGAVDLALGESVERFASQEAASRDMFLAVLGHDLRAPLQSIEMARIVLASAGTADDARLPAVMRIARASKIMDALITDLLEFTRRRFGLGLPIDRSDCDLRHVCEEAFEIVKAGDPRREFIEQMSGDLRITGDCARLRQALSNLLSNAVHHGDADAPISLRAHGAENSVMLSVSNFGKPIPPEALRIIFDPLVQVPTTTSDLDRRPKTSLGLGLFITREIVLGHQGTIDVQSSADLGTVFTIRLPRDRHDDRASNYS